MTSRPSSTGLDTLVSAADGDVDLQLLVAAMTTSRVGHWVWDKRNGAMQGDRIAADLLGLDFDGQSWPEAVVMAQFTSQDQAAFRESLLLSAAGYGRPFELTLQRQGEKPAGKRLVTVRGGLQQDATAKAPDRQIVGLIWEATETQEKVPQNDPLPDESDHSLRNVFSVLQALISLGARTKANARELTDTLNTQVIALAKVDMMASMRSRDVTRTFVSDILQAALSRWIDAVDQPGSAITIKTDLPHKVPNRQASSFVMMMYELVSEAEHYGPLGDNDGAVALTLCAHPDEGFVFEWRTQRGSTAAAAVGAKANTFSAALIQLCAGMLGTVHTFDMSAAGVHLEVHVHDPR